MATKHEVYEQISEQKISELVNELGIKGHQKNEPSLSQLEEKLSVEEILNLKIMLGDKEIIEKCLSLSPDFEQNSFEALAKAHGREDIVELFKQYHAEKAKKRTKLSKK